MNCDYCGKETNNKKYCSNICCNKVRSKKGLEAQHGKKFEYKVFCFKCGKEFSIFEFEKHFPTKKKYYCSIKCSNSRNHSDATKKKMSESNLKLLYGENFKEIKKELTTVKCQCGKEFLYVKRKRKFCSIICKYKYCLTKEKLSEAGRIGGLRSALKQNRRSKNEIYFGHLCKYKFNNVGLNEQMFNGWDADVILKDYKLAILWNGIWHHKKISKKHSLAQVQNRDRIKINEIKKCEYESYIINDYGKYNKKFVENEFEKLIKYITNRNTSYS